MPAFASDHGLYARLVKEDTSYDCVEGVFIPQS